jgi:plasmid stability protein
VEARKNRAMTKTPTKKPATFTIRMPQELKDQLQVAATYNGHSMNTEILLRLTTAGVGDQYELIMRESGEIKAMLRELLDKD